MVRRIATKYLKQARRKGVQESRHYSSAPREMQQVADAMQQSADKAFERDETGFSLADDVVYLTKEDDGWLIGSNYEQFGRDYLVYHPDEGQWYYRSRGRDNPIPFREAMADAKIWFTG